MELRFAGTLIYAQHFWLFITDAAGEHAHDSAEEATQNNAEKESNQSGFPHGEKRGVKRCRKKVQTEVVKHTRAASWRIRAPSREHMAENLKGNCQRHDACLYAGEDIRFEQEQRGLHDNYLLGSCVGRSIIRLL